MKVSSIFVALVFLGAPGFARAEVKLPSIFGDHMVLEQETKVPVWGTAAPNEKVTVTVGDHTASAMAGSDGKWRVDLAPFANGTGATTMTVVGSNTLTCQDVLVGEVWVASGQSNMEAAVSYDYNAKTLLPQATDPQLRLFLMARRTSLDPLTDSTSPFGWGRKPPVHLSDGDQPGRWVVCNPHDVGEFSAVAYFFGKELREHLKRPVGIIGSYWGGTLAESWTSLAGLQKAPPFQGYLDAYQKAAADFPKLNPDYQKAQAAYIADLKDYETKVQAAITQFQEAQKAFVAAQKAGTTPLPPDPGLRPVLPVQPKAPPTPDGGHFQPSVLFNGMIAPLIPYAIRGVIWYQGESNTREKSLEYSLLFPRLIGDWREKWGQGDFPFLYVQISHFPYAVDGTSALIREAQLKALSVPKTGMAVVIDIPCDDAGHPHDKEDPGKRLALAARHVAYGEDVVSSGPIYQAMKVEGATIRISFSETNGGLVIGTTPYQPATFGNRIPIVPLPTDKLVGFTIAGADKKFVPADAKIDGSTVIVSAAAVTTPAAVRFAWGDSVQCNLYNKANLPASPFRTDAWNDFKYSPLAPGVLPPSFGPEYFGGSPAPAAPVAK